MKGVEQRVGCSGSIHRQSFTVMLGFARADLFTSWLDFLLIFVPATIALEVLRADPLLVFVSVGLAIIPLAGLLGRAPSI